MSPSSSKLALGQVESDSSEQARHRRHRYGHISPAEQVPLPEHHVGHRPVSALGAHGLDLTDLPIESVDRLTLAESHLSAGERVGHHGLHQTLASEVVGSRGEEDVLGGGQRLEGSVIADEPDPAIGHLGQVNRDKTTQTESVSRLDHEMGHLGNRRVHHDTGHLAERPLRIGHLGPDGVDRRRFHPWFFSLQSARPGPTPSSTR